MQIKPMAKAEVEEIFPTSESGRAKRDYSAYVEALKPYEVGDGFTLKLDEGETAKLAMRRLNGAAKTMGIRVRWKDGNNGFLHGRVTAGPVKRGPRKAQTTNGKK